MRNKIKSVIAILFLLVCCTAFADTEKLIITGATLIDVESRQSVDNISVLIQGDQIKEVRRGNFSKSQRRNAQVITARGKYLVPGLMDIHIHLVGSVKVGVSCALGMLSPRMKT